MKISALYSQQHLAIQQTTYTCGPAALLNILHLKGDFSHDEPELARLGNAKPGIGTSHEDLLRTAEAVGLVLITQARDASIDDIRHHVDNGLSPLVNYIDAFSGHGHYAVITEYDDAALYLFDSTLGLLRLEYDFFTRHWRSGDDIPQWYAAFQ